METAASRCAVAAAELETHIRALGGETHHSGAVTGALHRAWSNLKSSVSTMDDHAVLAECESAEDTAKGAYEAALKKDLTANVRALIERQYQGVKENHDRIRHL